MKFLPIFLLLSGCVMPPDSTQYAWYEHPIFIAFFAMFSIYVACYAIVKIVKAIRWYRKWEL